MYNSFREPTSTRTYDYTPIELRTPFDLLFLSNCKTTFWREFQRLRDVDVGEKINACVDVSEKVSCMSLPSLRAFLPDEPPFLTILSSLERNDLKRDFL